LIPAALAAALASVLAAADPAPAGPPAPRPASVHARAERDEVRLGEPFAYEIQVRHPASEEYALPEAPDLGPFRASGGVCRREPRGDEAVTTCSLTLALLDLGAHEVPEIRLRVRTPAGDATIAVPGPRVEAPGDIDPAVATGDLPLRDLAPPVPLLVPSWRPVLWAAALAAAALLALAARLAWRRLRARAAAGPADSPHERLAGRLDRLEADALFRRGRAREHWFRLSAIVRETLAAGTGLDAPDLTTAEIATRLGRRPDPRLDGAALRAHLEEADLVKFARDPSSEERCLAGIAFARDLLHRTRPVSANPPNPSARPESPASHPRRRP
jgi:hypothetical protein